MSDGYGMTDDDGFGGEAPRPRLTFYKRGGAFAFELRPAVGTRKGSVRVIAASQAEGGGYDWEGGVSLKLGVKDLFALLPVLRGEAGSADAARVFSASPSGADQARRLRYSTSVARGRAGECLVRVGVGYEGDDELASVEATLTRIEARGLAAALDSALGRLAFGCD